MKREKVELQEAELRSSRTTQKDLTSKLLLVTEALERANVKNDQYGGDRVEHLQHSNDALRNLVDDLVHDQKAYQGQFQDLMTRYEKLMEDRQRVMSVFEKQTTLQAEKEAMVISSFKAWMNEQEQKQRHHDHHPQIQYEEKKVDEEGRALPQLTIQTTPSGLIDLSQMASP
jgi:hypothetical protein